MPTRPLPPVRSIHSWSLVYLKPSGYAIVSPRAGPRACAACVPRRAGLKACTTTESPALLLSLVKRHRHDARTGAPAADVDVELGVQRGVLDRQIGHADGLLHVRRL